MKHQLSQNLGGKLGGTARPAPPLATALIISSILYFNVSLVVAVV